MTQTVVKKSRDPLRHEVRTSIFPTMAASPTRRGKKDPLSYYRERAGQLGVSFDHVLSCAKNLPGQKCKDCDETAVDRNKGFCVECAAFWLPKPGEPGTALLGSAFMRSESSPINKTLCCCKQSTCRSFGYCGRGRLPSVPATQRASPLAGLGCTRS